MKKHDSNNLVDTIQGESFHFRLCHFCLNLNESHTVVKSCQRCGRTLANTQGAHELYREVAHEVGEDSPDRTSASQEELDEMEATVSEALPINGLSVVW